MKVVVFNEKRIDREDRPPFTIITDKNGVNISHVYFEWIKDPEIPIVRIDLRNDYDTIRTIGKSSGFGNIRKWITNYSDDTEGKITHIIFRLKSIDILFDDEAIFCAFKMTFDENDRIIFEDSF